MPVVLLVFTLRLNKSVTLASLKAVATPVLSTAGISLQYWINN